MEILNIIKVMVPATVAFIVGITITPVVTHYLYKYKIWKKKPGKVALDGTEAVEFNKICKDGEIKTPRMGGIVIWASSVLTIIGIYLISKIFPSAASIKMDFLSRSQTWIPLFTLLFGAGVGFINDVLDSHFHGNGLSLRRRLVAIIVLSTFIGWWFYTKLAITTIGIPFAGVLEIGWLIIPFFVLVSLAVYASGVIDGIDGLSGGVFATIFAAYAGIAFYQHQIDLAAFAAMLTGSILAFLWFNIPPARFYMTETGTMALTLTITVLAFMTDSLGGGIGIAVLPIIAFLLVATVASNLLQVLSKKFRGKKLFRIAPIHHHFEAIGWSSAKVVMRYWVLGIMFAFVGFIIALIG